jgi:transposase InsO family protein
MNKRLSWNANLKDLINEITSLQTKNDKKRIHDIHSNQGSQFQSKYWKTKLEKLQISPTTTSLYYPQSDGLSERNIQNIPNKLRILSRDDNGNWYRYLQVATKAVNANKATATKECPK